MAGLLQQLENNEAVLLMYLAGELPPEDRVEVELMLANDPTLRAQLDGLRGLEQSTAGALAALDRSEPLPEPAEVVARRVARAMARHQVRRTVTAPARAEERSRPRLVAPWMYPMAAAALLLIAFATWQATSKPEADRSTASTGTGKSAIVVIAPKLMSSVDPAAVASALESLGVGGDDAIASAHDSPTGLAAAERHLYELRDGNGVGLDFSIP